MKKVIKQVGINAKDLIKRNKELEDAVNMLLSEKRETFIELSEEKHRNESLSRQVSNLEKYFNNLEKDYLHLSGMYNILVAIVNRSIPYSKDADEQQMLRKIPIARNNQL